MNHEQLVIIQKKAAVFVLRHEKTKKHELIEKTAQYFEREINGEAVSFKEWGGLARALARALARDLARALDLDRGRGRAQGLVDYLTLELGDFVPTLNNPDQFILDSLSGTVSLEMTSYHNGCGTTHCRAGFIEIQAGEIGKTLVKYFDHWLASAILYKKATGEIANFFASNEEAMKSIKEGAAKWEASR